MQAGVGTVYLEAGDPLTRCSLSGRDIRWRLRREHGGGLEGGMECELLVLAELKSAGSRVLCQACLILWQLRSLMNGLSHDN